MSDSKWPTEKWHVLLQSSLKGKSKEAYMALLISECECVNAILKTYELACEAYL